MKLGAAVLMILRAIEARDALMDRLD